MNTTFDMLLSGYRDALNRFMGASVPASHSVAHRTPVFIPLLDALGWIVVIDLHLAKRRGPDWWANVPGGQTIRGIRYVRNRVFPDWLAAVNQGSAGRLTLREPHAADSGVAMWTWLPTLPKTGIRDGTGERHYTTRVANRSVRDTLNEVNDLLARVSK